VDQLPVRSGPVQDSKTNSAAVIAGVVGALAGVFIIVGIILGLLWKHKKDRAKLVGRFDKNLAEGKNSKPCT
jgi:preprotein translocase subunit SecG